MKKIIIALMVLIGTTAVASPVFAAISFVGANSSQSSTVTIPAHQMSDLIIVTCANGTLTLCTVPTGQSWWTRIISGAIASSVSLESYYFVATSTNEISGTWTGGTRMIAAVYRGEASTTPIGASGTTTTNGSSQIYPALTLTVSDGTSWVVGVCSDLTSNSTSCQTAPSGMTNRGDSGSGAAPRTGESDTNSGVASWTQKTVVGSGSGPNVVGTYEILAGSSDTTAPVPGGTATATSTNTYDNGTTLNWLAATDNVTSQSNLLYAIYRSTSNNINSVANAESNGILAVPYTANITTYDVTGLSPTTSYWLTVLVKDQSGNKASYSSVNVTTITNCVRDIILDFSSGGSSGTALSASALDSSTYGVNGSNWTISLPSGNFTFDTSANHPLWGKAPVLCLNSWPGQHDSFGAKLLIDNTLHNARYTFPGTVASTTTAGFWFMSDYPTSQSGVNIDMTDIQGTSGSDFTNLIFEVTNGHQQLSIETGGGDPTAFLTFITPGNWYYITFKYTAIPGTTVGQETNVYDSNFKLLATSGRKNAIGTAPFWFRFGHYSVTPAQNLPGSNLYWDSIRICYVGTCKFPLLPIFSGHLTVLGKARLMAKSLVNMIGY